MGFTQLVSIGRECLSFYHFPIYSVGCEFLSFYHFPKSHLSVSYYIFIHRGCIFFPCAIHLLSCTAALAKYFTSICMFLLVVCVLYVWCLAAPHSYAGMWLQACPGCAVIRDHVKCGQAQTLPANHYHWGIISGLVHRLRLLSLEGVWYATAGHTSRPITMSACKII